MILWIIIAQVISSACNAVMDTLKFRYSRSIFAHISVKLAYTDKEKSRRFRRWWGPESWRNKYTFGLPNTLPRLIFTTVLVWVTDAWHFFQAGWYTSYQILIVALAFDRLPFLTPYPFADFIIYLGVIKVIHGLIFELFFNLILIKK
jgi:hypothetical protein